MTPSRVRFRYTKLGKIRFIGHRDVARVWERALRKAGLPVSYTEGFSPRPKLSFGLALPTGYESRAEFVDVSFGADPGDLSQVAGALSTALPAGMEVSAAAGIAPGTMSLQQSVTACLWQIRLEDASVGDAATWTEQILSAPRLVVSRERKGKTIEDDVRPQVLGLTPDGHAVLAELATQPRALRPSELTQVVEPPLAVAGYVRLEQLTTLDGARRAPLTVGAAVAADTEVAS